MPTSSTLAALVVAAVLSLSVVAAADPPRSLGDWTGPWQLFVDDYLIAERTNLVRSYHAFEKYPQNPVHPVIDWMPGGRGTVLPKADGTGWIRYADRRATVGSADLIHWGERKSAKPEAVGSGVSVMHTPWDVGREFKLVAYQKHGKSPYTSFHGFTSRDGTSSWTPLETNPLMFADADTLQFGWDPHRKRYFGTMKIWSDVRGEMRRCVGITTSTDFSQGWSPAQMILIPDTVDDRWTTEPKQRTDFYSFSAFAYETMYLGLVEVFRVTDGRRAETLQREAADGHIHIELLTSRDGTTWRRLDERGPVLPVGPLGSWDAGMIKIPSHPVVDGDKIKLLYYASFYSHAYGRGGYPTKDKDDDKTSALGLAVMRKDGWASLDAGANEGSVTTRVLDGVEGTLAVNFVTARGRGYGTGWIKAEVLEADGRAIPGYSLSECDELRGDSLDQVVTWQGRTTLPAGRPVRLRFVMTDARLYSFRAGDAVRVDAAAEPLRFVQTFEGPGGRDGVYFQNDAAIEDDPDHAAFGAKSVCFGDGPAELEYVVGNPRPPAKDVRGNGLELDNTFRLGNRFTLAAQVNSRDPSALQRLFSSFDPYPERSAEIHIPHDRTGPIGSRELIFDFTPAGARETGCLRLVVHGQTVTAAGSFNPDEYHHLAAVYDDGRVVLYLDGREIGGGTVAGGGPVWQLVNLHVGTDSGPFNDRFQGRVPNYQLRGRVDDVVVLGEALSPDDLQALSRQGAAAFFPLQSRAVSPR